MQIKMGQDEKYQTRDGRKVRILAVDGKNRINFPVIALIEDRKLNREDLIFLRSNGNVFDNVPIEYDIIEVPKKFTYQRWVNIYPEDQFPVNPTTMHSTRENADSFAISGRIACVTVIVEGTEGEGL